MNEAVNAEMIRKALEETYTTPEWYLGFEVGNSTGADCKRHADAVAINVYPSKGFETRGFEVKVSKGDLKSELENGIKSDEVARYCDYWFLVVPKGLTKDFTLPPTWGVIEYENGKLRQKSKAKKLEKIPPTSGFLCAMLRGRQRITDKRAKEISELEKERIIRETKYLAGNAEKELNKLREKLKEINEATGIDIDSWTPPKEIINNLKAARSLRKITKEAENLALLSQALLKDTQRIKEITDDLLNGEENG